MYSPDSAQSLSLSWSSSLSDYSSYSSSDSSNVDIYSDIGSQYPVHIKLKKEENAVTRVIEEEAYCFNIVKFAQKLVNATFIEANELLTPKNEIKTPINKPCNFDWNEVDLDESNSSLKFEDDSVSLEWPLISEFNIKLGMEKVEQFVNKWERSSEWKYCVEFVGFECEECSNIFVFQVEWSKPTMSYPIPQATANVFFAMVVHKMVPYNYSSSVEVSYIFEFSTVIHHPGEIDFQEKWLEDIIEAKLQFFKTITFSVPKGFCE